MPAPDRPPPTLAALSDKEREILRLLTAGHTVKSIAAGLGRSEASINERLRDARRKTGVGSSRELARLLAAQKNWDRNFDLPERAQTADTAVPPGRPGRAGSKGTLIMLAAIPLAAAGLLLVATDSLDRAAPARAAPAAAAPTAASPPLVGKWSLDTARIPADERPQRVTIEFRLSPDRKWTTRVEIVAPDGTSTHAESTAAADGVAVPLTGTMGFIDTASLRQPAPNTLVMTLGKDGAPVSTRVYTVGKDRKSMTETIVWASGTMPRLETTYFNRVG